MTQEMKVIILQENSAAGNHGHIVVSVKTGWPTNAILSCPDDDDEHLTNNSTSNLYLSLPRVPGTLTSGHWRLSDKTPQHHHYQCCLPSISPSTAPRARVVLSKLVLTCQLLSIVQILYSLSTWNIALDTREAEREGMMGRCSLIKYK